MGITFHLISLCQGGLYLFAFYAVTQSNSQVWIQLFKNDEYQVSAYAHSSTDSVTGGRSHVILEQSFVVKCRWLFLHFIKNVAKNVISHLSFSNDRLLSFSFSSPQRTPHRTLSLLSGCLWRKI